MVKTQSLGLT